MQSEVLPDLQGRLGLKNTYSRNYLYICHLPLSGLAVLGRGTATDDLRDQRSSHRVHLRYSDSHLHPLQVRVGRSHQRHHLRRRCLEPTYSASRMPLRGPLLFKVAAVPRNCIPAVWNCGRTCADVLHACWLIRTSSVKLIYQLYQHKFVNINLLHCCIYTLQTKNASIINSGFGQAGSL